MVSVYVRKGDDEWIRALAVPLEDIRRFSLRPLKLLRFVTFTALGAKGDLSDTPGGNVVDYENVSRADLAEDNSYFTPEDETPLHLRPSSVKALRNRGLPFQRSKRSHYLIFF